MCRSNGMEQRKKGGWGKYVTTGCAGLFVLAIIGGFVAYWGIKGFVSNMVNQYTSGPG